jgi:hypothetical protein
LPARQGDVSSVLEEEHEAPIYDMWAFHVAKVNNVAPARTKEDRPVESTLAVAQRAPNKKLAIGEMDKRLVPAGLKERDVPNRSDPHFDIVGQEDKIVAMKYDRLIPPSGRKRLLGLFSNLYQRTHLLLKGKGFNAIG